MHQNRCGNLDLQISSEDISLLVLEKEVWSVPMDSGDSELAQRRNFDRQ